MPSRIDEMALQVWSLLTQIHPDQDGPGALMWKSYAGLKPYGRFTEQARMLGIDVDAPHGWLAQVRAELDRIEFEIDSRHEIENLVDEHEEA